MASWEDTNDISGTSSVDAAGRLEVANGVVPRGSPARGGVGQAGGT